MVSADIRNIEDFYLDNFWDGAGAALGFLDQMKELEDAHSFPVDCYERFLQSAIWVEVPSPTL